jgi:hypothetical protein
MNYFGHAAVATLRGDNARFVLGAMLPDLIPMAGVPVPKSFADWDLNRGLSYHVETDALFHNTRTFMELNRKALSDLRALGVSRGPARACAHIGVEMWIDAELAKDNASLSGYESALSEICKRPQVLFPLAREECQRAQGLCDHLLQMGQSAFHPSAEKFALRLHRTLSPRERLLPSADELVVIANYLSTFTDARERCSELMGELSPLFEIPASESTSDVAVGAPRP